MEVGMVANGDHSVLLLLKIYCRSKGTQYTCDIVLRPTNCLLES